MGTQGDVGFNLERGVFLFFAVVTVYVASSYMIERPLPPVGELTEARKDIKSGDIYKRSLTRPSPAVLLAGAGDVFAPHPLLDIKISAAKPPVVEPGPTVTTVNLPKAGVHLATKPAVVAVTPTPAEGGEKKPPPFNLPGKVVAILKPESNKSRRILVAPDEDPGNYLQFREGDEWAVGETHIKIAKIDPRRIIFQDEKGRVVVVDLDPLKDWAPLLRDQKQGNEKIDFEDIPFDPDGTAKGKKPQPQPQPEFDDRPFSAQPAPRDAKKRGDRSRKDIHGKRDALTKDNLTDIEKALRELLKRRADGMEKLGKTY